MIYDGKALPRWRGNLIVGTLKAADSPGWSSTANAWCARDAAQGSRPGFRNVAVGPDGNVYLLLEHASGGRIVRLIRAA